MHKRIANPVPVLVTIGLLASVGPQVQAQDELPSAAPLSAEVSPDDLQSIDDIQARVRDGLTELRALEEELKEAGDEERRVFERRIGERREEILTSAYELVDLVVEQEEAGEVAAAARSIAEDYVARVSDALQVRLLAAESELDTLREARSEQSAESLPAHNEKIVEQRRAVDTLLEALMLNVDKMRALGLDISSDRAFLVDFLDERADDLLTRLEVARERIRGLRDCLAETPDDTTLQSTLSAREDEAETIESSVETTLSLLGRLDAPARDYRKRLIELTGKVTTDIFDTGVAAGLLESWVNRVRTWLVENGPAVVFKTILFLLIVAAFRVLSSVVGSIVRRSASSSKLNFSQLLQEMLVSVVSRGILFLGLLLALSQVGVSLGPLLAGLGIAGFIVGFALQDTLGNFAAGVMILLYRPYDVGDLIETGGVFGKVGQMSLVSTTILTLDNQTLVVPNSKIWGDVIKNVTAQKIRRVDLTFGIGYGDDIPHAEDVLKSIIEEDSRVLSDPAAMVRLHELGDSSVNFIVRPWVRTEDYWNVYWDITREVKLRFDREGISIPFPQRDVHLHRAETAS